MPFPPHACKHPTCLPLSAVSSSLSLVCSSQPSSPRPFLLPTTHRLPPCFLPAVRGGDCNPACPSPAGWGRIAGQSHQQEGKALSRGLQGSVGGRQAITFNPAEERGSADLAALTTWSVKPFVLAVCNQASSCVCISEGSAWPGAALGHGCDALP